MGLMTGGIVVGSLGTLAINADKVDGFDAVNAKAGATKRAGKLVATDKQGRVPDASKLGGLSRKKLSTMSIPPTAAYASSIATMSADGPVLPDTGNGTMRVAFVVPPGHRASDPVTMDVVYREFSAGACTLSLATGGLAGPDAPNDQPNVHNGAWDIPGPGVFTGTIDVPAGAGSGHTARFTWPFAADPGMFVQFALTRLGDDAADTCAEVTVVGMQVNY
ncbi:MAG: hypothetical protein KDB63_04875 [Nocardioidaceae bacterium]|nr:hypothetical protein [Nocardioidaceae bacterium]